MEQKKQRMQELVQLLNEAGRHIIRELRRL